MKEIKFEKKVRTEVILLKRFASDEGVLKKLEVVQIYVKGKLKTINTFRKHYAFHLFAHPYKTRTLIFQKTQQKILLTRVTTIINPLIFL